MVARGRPSIPSPRVAFVVATILAWAGPLDSRLALSVYPDGASTVKPPNASNQTYSFTVTGLTSGQSYFIEFPVCTGKVTGCSSPLGQQFTAFSSTMSVQARFQTTSVGSGTVQIKIYKGGGPSDIGSVNVTVDGANPDIQLLAPTGQVTVQYPTIQLAWCDDASLNASSRWIKVNGVTRTSSFSYNAGQGPASCAVKATSTTSSVALNPGSNQIEARICDNANKCKTESYNVTRTDAVVPTVELLSATTVFTQYPTIQVEWCDNVSLSSSTRWIKVNGVDRTSVFNYVTGGSGCTVRATSTTSSQALNPGPNTIQGHICDTYSNCTTETFTITRTDNISPSVSLVSSSTVYTASPTIQIEWCDNESLDPGSDWIKVNGVDRTGSFNYVAGGGSCGVGATSTTSSVSLVVGPNTVEGHVCDTWGNCDTEPFTITRVAANAPIVTLLNHNRDNQDRGFCLTASAGDGAAVQCGDLLAFHGLPAFRSLNKARSLTLVYNSATAEPRPRVAAALQIPAGVSQPLNVYASLVVGGAIRASATYQPWTPGTTRSIALAFDGSGFATGLHPFSLTARATYPDATYEATVSDTLMIVDREDSDFGAGWYMAGVEQLVVNTAPNPLMWIGGDGSAKIYRHVASNPDRWLAPAGAYRDTIIDVGTNYERRGKHGVKVTFDGAGRHIRTTNRLGHVTTFVWSPTGRLIEITVPGTGGGD